MDPYQVLGVPLTASKREITDAYRALAQLHHPDRHAKSSPRVRREAERRMQELNEAYRLVRNRPPPAVSHGTGKVKSAAIWLGTAPGTWARDARRTGSQIATTEEGRRVTAERIAAAAAEHAARMKVIEDFRAQKEAAAGSGTAYARPKGPNAAKAWSGLGQALVTGEIRCKGCNSLQRLPNGWQHRLVDTNWHCSSCHYLMLAR